MGDIIEIIYAYPWWSTAIGLGAVFLIKKAIDGLWGVFMRCCRVLSQAPKAPYYYCKWQIQRDYHKLYRSDMYIKLVPEAKVPFLPGSNVFSYAGTVKIGNFQPVNTLESIDEIEFVHHIPGLTRAKSREYRPFCDVSIGEDAPVNVPGDGCAVAKFYFHDIGSNIHNVNLAKIRFTRGRIAYITVFCDGVDTSTLPETTALNVIAIMSGDREDRSNKS